ncbi:hypothetical protein [Marinicella meishanensis]|uniref:hypothetical protein n=1 Tax=Marinicella meishanensis TaxID=2873263 RepID=UPI001CBE8B25|nr:hypothetical protein [Marinicella sp. NBU2979]
MKQKNIWIALMTIVLTSVVHADVPPDPSPGCPGMDYVGSSYINSTYGFGTESTGCNGISSVVGPDGMTFGDYEFAEFDANLINEGLIETPDIKIKLRYTLDSMPYGGSVVIGKLLSGETAVAKLTLRKLMNISSVSNTGGKRGQQDPYRWELKVTWFGPFPTLNVEEKFSFGMYDELEYNFIGDYSDPEAPVEMIQFTKNGLSVVGHTINPHSDSGIAGLYFRSEQLDGYQLGLIETSVDLAYQDRISFYVDFDLGVVLY